MAFQEAVSATSVTRRFRTTTKHAHLGPTRMTLFFFCPLARRFQETRLELVDERLKSTNTHIRSRVYFL